MEGDSSDGESALLPEKEPLCLPCLARLENGNKEGRLIKANTWKREGHFKTDQIVLWPRQDGPSQ